MKLGGVGFVVALCASVSGCSNPKCWTHDESEVTGGCSAMSSREPARGSRGSNEAYRKRQREQLEEHRRACEAGTASSCGILAEIQENQTPRPAEATIEANFARACRGNVARLPSGQAPCLKAGAYAERRRGTGTADALQRYRLGCSLAVGEPCLAAARLDPAHELELVTAACEHQAVGGCARLAQILADPKSVHHDPARARALAEQGCRQHDDNMCAMLGRFEAEGQP